MLTLLCGIFSLFLVTLTSFSASVEEDQFYLALVRSARGSGSGSGGGMEGPAENRTCTAITDTDVRCSCGDPLRYTRDRYEEKLNSTCLWFEEVEEPEEGSPFSFCENTLRGGGYEVTMENSSLGSLEADTLFNKTSLRKRVVEMERRLRIFKTVLDRTITGILVDKKHSKCFCFDRYKRWLCAIHLPFYVASHDITEGQDCETRIPFGHTANDSVFPFRVRPCITLCHDVLQNCPYYLPSRYQPRTSRPDEPFETVVYGGYPAFDCPGNADKPGEYIFKNCSNCTRKGGARNHDSNRVIVTISILLLLLVIRTIT